MLISGRRLAIDYGDARIGISLSDPMCIVASPLVTIANSEDLKVALTEIARLIEENEVAVVYVGLPLHLSGMEGESAAKVRHFSSLLKAKLPSSIEMRLVDERLSTASAQRGASEVGKQLSKENVDQWAAVSILESALHREKLSDQLAGVTL